MSDVQQIMTLLSRFMTAAEAAERIGISKPRLWQLVGKGRLTPAFSVGELRMFCRSEVEAFADTPRPRGIPFKADAQ